ncbi:hypothetical protein I302_108898 [Kwoniella bestiolae CBS 10118]|uniref:WD40 repeat-like protein n=1 Tax=Kwoniella bestiolae CBS 10118 TaxID=1296100 RepID=A0A1B9FUE3_9TREE|nr:hypothetical protein I302_08036 [Kwoniella bestiolae CBS 10118]OCF22388.1 hypothetical protein I302_08036 [Kwoniella bestiolae CBS 10118]
MQLGRYSVSTLRPPPIHSITFSEDGRFFAVAGEEGYEVWRGWPLVLVRRRVLPGTLTLALLLPQSPLLVLQGGGANPLYPPNKAVIYHDKLSMAIAEVEFGERIRGIRARKGMICVALSRKVTAFEYGLDTSSHTEQPGQSRRKDKGKSKEVEEGFWLRKFGEWETAENEMGLMALSTSPGSSLLALPGRQPGHVQLISLPPCPPIPPTSNPSSTAFRAPIILAHTHPLSTLSCTFNGSHIITTSERGTLLRIWDTTKGRLERELRRGVDKAEMWGCKFESERGGKGRVVAWSDKGTVHVWKDEEGSKAKTEGTRSSTPTPSSTPSLTHILSRNLPLPKYFSSSPSIAQYHLPRKNPHAISSALGKAGVNVPSMRNDDIDNEESEQFMVGWIDVETTSTSSSEDPHTKVERRSSVIYDSPTPGAGGAPMMGLGGREERRSFGSGSDNTSRTVTPLPGPGPGRRNSITRTVSSNFVNKSQDRDQDRPKSKVHTTITPSTRPTTTEKQLIVITYSGDWYRLRIPDESYSAGEGEGEREEMKRGGSKCELVEYRRLGVGGGGW